MAITPLIALRRFCTSRRLLERHALPVYVQCFIGILIITTGVTMGAFDYDRGLFADIAGTTAIILSFAFLVRWTGFRKLADPVEQIMLLYFSAMIIAFCSFIFASRGAPLADPLLRSADRLLFGIDRVTFIADLHLSPGWIRVWRWIYQSFAVTPILAMGLLVFTNRHERAWAVLTALTATAMVSIMFVAFLPAHGVPPYPFAYVHVLDGARDGALRTLDGSVVTGLVTFPSMHAADAVILAWAFSWFGRWAMPLVALNILVFFSALVVGSHYVVDLLGGGALGGALLYGSLRLHRWLGTTESPTAAVDTPPEVASGYSRSVAEPVIQQ